MKLYRTYAVTAALNDDERTKVSKWDGTQADASARRKALKGMACTDVETKEVDVPTDKPGLLAWLNANVTGE